MKNKSASIDLKQLGPQLLVAAQKLNRYAGILFFVLVAGVYGYVIVSISSLSNVQPDESAISSQAAAGSIPKVDPRVVQQLQSLKDNSGNVQTLFDNARQNPFQE